MRIDLAGRKACMDKEIEDMQGDFCILMDPLVDMVNEKEVMHPLKPRLVNCYEIIVIAWYEGVIARGLPPSSCDHSHFHIGGDGRLILQILKRMEKAWKKRKGGYFTCTP